MCIHYLITVFFLSDSALSMPDLLSELLQTPSILSSPPLPLEPAPPSGSCQRHGQDLWPATAPAQSPQPGSSLTFWPLCTRPAPSCHWAHLPPGQVKPLLISSPQLYNSSLLHFNMCKMINALCALWLMSFPRPVRIGLTWNFETHDLFPSNCFSNERIGCFF